MEPQRDTGRLVFYGTDQTDTLVVYGQAAELKEPEQSDPRALAQENQRLRAEIEQLKCELARLRDELGY